ncbi:hypothetical protein RFI_23528 [Reticulomyxa filosa]|uniref:Protein kinase domain-containing protein n=1 Tax=Reticulomyxa filosa TaxID=46433 RepID=X6ML95_RETFI|nr:hypothetical protein RFI_23528 [Reticulomyxa filosa]|eukprot:ETO13840.1 hypothetical protein RFI_23528 [Reticulomyxa filosa]
MSSKVFLNENPESRFLIIQPLGQGLVKHLCDKKKNERQEVQGKQKKAEKYEQKKRSYGSVYKAVDTMDEEIVALKIMPDEVDKGSLEKEVRTLKKLKSPYVVFFRDAFLWDGNIWVSNKYKTTMHIIHTYTKQ